MTTPFPDNYIKLVAAADAVVNSKTSDAQFEAIRVLSEKLRIAKSDIAYYAAEAMQPPTDEVS